MNTSDRNRSYWHDNLLVVGLLLTIWFVIAFVCSIFGVEFLNRFRIGQVGLGFWIAQQGSIFIFVLIVLAYAIWMDRLDQKHHVEDER